MQTSLDVICKDAYSISLKGGFIHGPKISESRLRCPSIEDVKINGLLIEQSFIHTLIACKIYARNLVIGPHTSITWSLLSDVKIKFAHAVMHSIVSNTFIINSGFRNGTYRATKFIKNAFYNTIFVGCKFIASTFEDCSFSGCMFYKCSF
ncbi:MAG: hypothetical protein KAS32_27405, partial [Candidatus Peribacteraceae bacterium]|nr:hypothetical protein [Candidatus Peribacteraceae bacterium]